MTLFKADNEFMVGAVGTRFPAQVLKLFTMSFDDVERLANIFIPLCLHQCCLPYLEKGGLQQDLVAKCKAWIVALLSLDSQLRFKWTTVVKAAFTIVHELNIENLELWDVKAEKAKSWVGKMTSKLQLLVRHFNQARKKMPPPTWVNLVSSSKLEAAESETEHPESEGDEESEEEQADESKVATHTAAAATPAPPASSDAAADYEYGFSKEDGEAWASRIKKKGSRRRLEWTKTWVVPSNPLPEEPLVAVWPDGHSAPIPEYPVKEKYPAITQQGLGKALPPKKKRATENRMQSGSGRQKTKTALYMSGGANVTTRMGKCCWHCSARKSRSAS